jgi:hypothetical protein
MKSEHRQEISRRSCALAKDLKFLTTLLPDWILALSHGTLSFQQCSCRLETSRQPQTAVPEYSLESICKLSHRNSAGSLCQSFYQSTSVCHAALRSILIKTMLVRYTVLQCCTVVKRVSKSEALHNHHAEAFRLIEVFFIKDNLLGGGVIIRIVETGPLPSTDRSHQIKDLWK